MRNKQGFTLLEVLVTLSILSLLMGYIFIYFGNEISLYYLKDNRIELKQDARIAINRIVSKIRKNNNLSYVSGPDGTGIIYKGTDILINTTKNDPEGEINYHFDNDKGNGEIRNSNGNIIVDNIKDFRLERQEVEGTDGLVRIILVCGNNESLKDKEYSTTVRIFGFSG